MIALRIESPAAAGAATELIGRNDTIAASTTAGVADNVLRASGQHHAGERPPLALGAQATGLADVYP